MIHENSTIQTLIVKYAPDFCWLTKFDILILLEQVYEDINEKSVEAVLCVLTKRGYFVWKPDTHPTNFGYNRAGLYLRIKSLSGEFTDIGRRYVESTSNLLKLTPGTGREKDAALQSGDRRT